MAGSTPFSTSGTLGCLLMPIKTLPPEKGFGKASQQFKQRYLQVKAALWPV
jgi:hypothetical protein